MARNIHSVDCCFHRRGNAPLVLNRRRLHKGGCVWVYAPLSAHQEFFERHCLHNELYFCTRIPGFLTSQFETSMSISTRDLFPGLRLQHQKHHHRCLNLPSRCLNLPSQILVHHFFLKTTCTQIEQCKKRLPLTIRAILQWKTKKWICHT